MNDDDTRRAAALARHIKAALLHLRHAEDIAAAAGIDIDGGNDTGRLIRAAGEATEDLDLWAVNNARRHGADPAETYQHTERWCHAPGGQLPEKSWPARASAEARASSGDSGTGHHPSLCSSRCPSCKEPQHRSGPELQRGAG